MVQKLPEGWVPWDDEYVPYTEEEMAENREAIDGCPIKAGELCAHGYSDPVYQLAYEAGVVKVPEGFVPISQE